MRLSGRDDNLGVRPHRRWQDAGVTRAVRNIGTTRIEYLEFELK
jgi:hypothetical protein